MASDINGIRWKQGRVGQATPTEAPPSTIDKVPASETKSPDFDIAFARQLVQHRQRHDVNDSQSRHMRNDELDALQRLLQAFDAIVCFLLSFQAFTSLSPFLVLVAHSLRVFTQSHTGRAIRIAQGHPG